MTTSIFKKNILCVLLYTAYLAASYAQVCDTFSITKERHNLGIYGGLASDLSYLNTNNRLFANVVSASTLLYTDDTCKTWHQAFQFDSLDYECGTRGWGGGGTKTLCNNNGWVLVHSLRSDGTMAASIISYQNGDSGTFQTLMDSYLLDQLGDSAVVNGIGLTDYFAYTLMGPYIVQQTASTRNIIDINNFISGLSGNTHILKIAAANNSNGYPYYITIDTTGENLDEGQFLYRYDGSTFSKITLPSGTSTVNGVFTHPNQPLGDTLFISITNTSNAIKFYRSYNKGTSWTNITIPNGTNVNISDVDYSATWQSQYSQGKGIVIIAPGKGISKDLGSSWDFTSNIMGNGEAIHPKNINYIVACNTSAVALSTNGAMGPFSAMDNEGYNAVQIKKIARTKNEGAFYLATYFGLAYTTAYLNNNVAPFDKWQTPYGSISNTSYQYTAVAIDLSDSLHVVAGYSTNGLAKGFSVSTTGSSGFSSVLPSFTTADFSINDIAFVNSSILIAVTGGNTFSQTASGNIWRSSDGGNNWSKLSVSGFKDGNTIAVAYSGGDTVIYIGTGMNAIDTGYIWKSTDLGINWSIVNTGPSSITDPSVTGIPVLGITVDPRGTDTLYIVGGYEYEQKNGEYDQAFVASYDGGQNYHSINISGEHSFSAVEINSNNPDSVVYVTNGRNIYWYIPVMDTAVQIFKGMPGEVIPDISIGSILVGTTTGFYGVENQITTPTIITNILKNSIDNTVNVYPNPINDIAYFEFNSEKYEQVNASITDITGRVVTTILSEKLNAGKHHYKFSLSNLQYGIYFLVITSDSKKYCEKIFIAR